MRQAESQHSGIVAGPGRGGDRITWAVFDIGGVLLTQGVEDYDREVFEVLGVDGYPSVYHELFPALQRGEIGEAEFWAKVAGHPVSIEALGEAWKRHFRPIPGMMALAEDLRRRGVRTAILSNTEDSHATRMRRMAVLAGFEPRGFSCEIGSRKPETASFQWILDRLGVPAAQVAFIDDREENIVGAAALGFKTALYQGDAGETGRQLFAF